MFNHIYDFESELAAFTGAKYVISTDCCTHAIELCLIYDKIKRCSFTCYTYLSLLMIMHKLGISYDLSSENWLGEYRFYNTRIWDSARRLEPNMYKKGQLQCLSFGYDKPLDIGRGGAILTDSYEDYKTLAAMRYDGRDIDISPWEKQKEFKLGYHYKLNPEECIRGLEQLENYKRKGHFVPIKKDYPDCREIKIV